MSEQLITGTFESMWLVDRLAFTHVHTLLRRLLSLPTNWVTPLPGSEWPCVQIQASSAAVIIASRQWRFSCRECVRRIWMRSVTLGWCISHAQIRSFSSPSSWCGSVPYNRAGGWGFPKRRNLTEEGGGKALIQRKVVILYLQPVRVAPPYWTLWEVELLCIRSVGTLC